MVNKLIIFLMALTASFTFTALAGGDTPNGDNASAHIDISTVAHPCPRFADVTNPVVMYNTVTNVLTITLDATYYGEYTITIESDLTTVDYYPTSSTTVIPLTGADNSITIYIDSDECGCWYGELDKAEFGGQLDI